MATYYRTPPSALLPHKEERLPIGAAFLIATAASLAIWGGIAALVL